MTISTSLMSTLELEEVRELLRCDYRLLTGHPILDSDVGT